MPITSLVDDAGLGLNFTRTSFGNQFPITPIPSILFYDNFNGTTIDTIGRWATPVVAGTGTMTQSGGLLTATVGTTISNGAAINTQETYEPTVGGDLSSGGLLTIDVAQTTNANCCIGFYTRPASFTAATPVQDGFVWERDINGSFGASIYSAGTRTYRQTVSLGGAPFTGVRIAYTSFLVNFYFGLTQVPTFSVPITGPGSTTGPTTINLPFGFHSINHTTGPATAPIWSTTGVVITDSNGVMPVVFNGAYERPRSPKVFKNINGVASGTTLWTPVTGKRFRLMGYCLMTTTANGVLTLTDSTAAVVIPGGIIPISTTAPSISPPQGNGYLSTAANSTITQTFTGGGALSGYLFGTEE